MGGVGNRVAVFQRPVGALALTDQVTTASDEPGARLHGSAAPCKRKSRTSRRLHRESSEPQSLCRIT
jgi:hypothetical protein